MENTDFVKKITAIIDNIETKEEAIAILDSIIDEASPYIIRLVEGIVRIRGSAVRILMDEYYLEFEQAIQLIGPLTTESITKLTDSLNKEK